MLERALFHSPEALAYAHASFLRTASSNDVLADAVYVRVPLGVEADHAVVSGWELDARKNGVNGGVTAILSADRDLFELASGGPGKVFLRLVPGRPGVVVASHVFPRDAASQPQNEALCATAASELATLEARYAHADAVRQQAKDALAAHRRAGPAADAAATQRLQAAVDAAHKTRQAIGNARGEKRKLVRVRPARALAGRSRTLGL